ncbi:MAG: S-adenosylmethionine decarboxylase [Bacteroidia bacterium]
MKIYSILLTLEVDSSYEFDEGSMMSRFLVVIESQFDVKNTVHHIFANGAFTYAIILAESHAVIQTYPELNKIFISLEYHEENEKCKVIKDAKLVSDLKEALGGSIVGYEKLER